jgi:hypothetical protein
MINLLALQHPIIDRLLLWLLVNLACALLLLRSGQ